MNNQQGQSIIEILIGGTLITLVLTTVVLMSTSSVQLSDLNSYREQAIELARIGIENIRTRRNEERWSDFSLPYDVTEPSIIINDISYTRRIVIIPDPNDVRDDKRQVTVTVSWTDIKGDHQVEQITFMTKWQ